MEIHESKIRKIGFEARKYIKEPHGYCYKASKYIVEKIKNEYGLTDDDICIYEALVGECGTIKHYVVKLKSEFLSRNYSSYTVLIDVTLDQYCSKNKNEGHVKVSFGPKENIDKVNIFNFSNAPYKNT